MNQNWYTQDFAPKPPKQPSYIWVWLLSVFFVFLGFIAVAVFLVLRQVPPGKNFGQWIAESASTDNSQRLEFRKSLALQRLDLARAAYAGNQIAASDVTPRDLEQIKSLLKSLTSVSGEDDSAFEALTSVPEFRDRVRKAPSLSLLATRQFQLEFDDWFTMYSPYYNPSIRIELAAVTRDPADHTLIAYTWVFNTSYPERVAWYLRSNGNKMRIVDYEILDTSSLLSDESAREFSAAFTGTYWDNYLAIHKASESSIDETAMAKAELTRLSQFKFPKSIAHWAYYRLGMTAYELDDKELSLQLLAKSEEIAPTPGIYWQRATIFLELKDYAKATENLRKYTDMIGPGPECFQLEAEIATSLKDHERANIAWINLLAMDPNTTSIPWNFHHHMSSANGKLLADSLHSHQDSAFAAQTIATMLIARDRGDLAEALLPLAESMSEPTPELLALRAEMAKFNGDDAGYLSNLEKAWRAAAPDNLNRSIWLYNWANALQSDGRGAEAIAASPDPATTFCDLALDEDGELQLSPKELRSLSDALQQTSAKEEEAKKLLKVWKQLAPVAVDVQRHDHNAVWQSLSRLLAADSAGDRNQLAELLEELDLSWTVDEWLAESAVRSGHALEAWDLLPEGDSLRDLLWHIESSKYAELVPPLANRLRQDSPDHMDLIYCEALLADLKEDYPTALQKYQEFLQHPDIEESSFRYRANNNIVAIALKQADWKSAAAALPNDVLLGSLIPRLQLADRFEDAEAALAIARQQGATLVETVSTEASLLHDQRKWAALSELCKQWLAARKSGNSEFVESEYSSSTMAAKFMDAMMMTNDLDRAEEVIAQLPEVWYAATWKLRVAVARDDRAAAEAIFADAAAVETGSLPDVSELGPVSEAYWSDAWKDFRDLHPMDFYDINHTTSDFPDALILQSSPGALDAMELQTSLQTAGHEVTVSELTDVLRQIEASAMKHLPVVTDNSTDLAEDATEIRRIYRITVDGISFLVCTGSDSYHNPASGKASESGDEIVEAFELSEPLRNSVMSHRGWIKLRAAPSTTLDVSRAKSLNAMIVAALLNDRATVVSIAGATTIVSSEVRATLAAGSTSNLPKAESYVPDVTEPLMDRLDKNSSLRLRALRKRLSELPPDAPVPGIKLVLSMPGVWQRDRTVMECPLLAWEPKAFPTQFTVSLDDSPLIAPSYRGERAVVMTWSLLDWREE